MKRISMRSLLVGIDPGSLYTRVVVADAQQEISEPSLAAVTTQGEVVAVGTEAAIRLRAEPRGLVAVRPFVGGVVAQQAAAQLLLQTILDKVQRGAVTRPTVCLAVPSLPSQVAVRAWLQTTRKAGVLETLLVDRGAATAIGTGWDPSRAEAVVAADCGAGADAASELGEFAAAGDAQGDGGGAGRGGRSVGGRGPRGHRRGVRSLRGADRTDGRTARHRCGAAGGGGVCG